MFARRTIAQKNGIDRPGAGAVGNAYGDADGVAQSRIVDPGDAFADCQFGGKHGQLRQQDRGLNRIQPSVHARAQHLVAGGAFAVGAQAAIQRRPFRAFGEQRAAIAVGTERLGWEEADRRGVRGRAELAAMQGGTEALGAIVQREDPLTRRQRAQRRPVRRLAEQIDADHRPRAQFAAGTNRGDALFQMGGIDLEGQRIDVAKHRRRPQHQGHFGRCGIGEGRQKHRIPPADALCHHRDLQCVGAGRN